MTDHAATHATEPVHSGHGSEDPRIEAARALKFEASELRDFERADKSAGQMMGKLLAFLFCVLLFLMTGVNLWMIGRDATGTDPQGPVGGVKASHSEDASHH